MCYSATTLWLSLSFGVIFTMIKHFALLSVFKSLLGFQGDRSLEEEQHEVKCVLKTKQACLMPVELLNIVSGIIELLRVEKVSFKIFSKMSNSYLIGPSNLTGSREKGEDGGEEEEVSFSCCSIRGQKCRWVCFVWSKKSVCFKAKRLFLTRPALNAFKTHKHSNLSLIVHNMIKCTFGIWFHVTDCSYKWCMVILMGLVMSYVVCSLPVIY